MEDKEQTRINREKLKRHPKEETNFLSRLFFCWELLLIIRGWRNKLAEDDQYLPLKEYESKPLGDKLEKIWQDEKNFRKKPNLTRALIKLFGFEIALLGIVRFPVETASLILQPFCLSKLLDYFTPNQNEMNLKQACFYASIITLTNLLRIFTAYWTEMQLSVSGMKMRIACSSLIYRKSLNIKQSSGQKVTIGQTVNLLSNDVARIEKAVVPIHSLWTVPVNIVIATCYIYFTIGHNAVYAIAGIISLLLIQCCLSRTLAVARLGAASKTDYRIRLMNDIICGIQAIKLYTWENPFTQLVKNARNLEMKKVATSNRVRLFNNTFMIYVTKICILISLLVAILTGIPLTSKYVFTLYSICETLKTTSIMFSLALLGITEAKISMLRIQEFLLHDYQKPANLTKNIKIKNLSMGCVFKDHDREKPVGVHLRNVSVKWDESSPTLDLSCVNFKAVPGELVGVIGAAGSGKSTLLQVILKEVEVKGDVDVEGVISYACQEPWIFSGSIKQNILFGQAFNWQKYLKVIKVCALEHDMSLFPHGDQTLVGERGVMLSGGQKFRIGLARAVYRDADIYLLDDPLSAVDANVAQQITDECISNYLKEKCVVLVTHQTQYLHNVDKLYVVESRTVSDCTKNRDSDLRKYSLQVEVKKLESKDGSSLKRHSLQLEVKEHRGGSSTDSRVYKGYRQATGHWSLTMLILLLLVLRQLLSNGVDYFMTFWMNVEEHAIELNANLSKVFSTYNCLYIYIGILVLLVLMAHTTSLVFVVFCKKASKQLHNKMLSKIMHASVTFFNQHSSGRILNRFTKDIGCIDEEVPLNLLLTIANSFLMIGIAVIIIGSNYWMVIPTVLLLILIISYSFVHQYTIRNIKRTEGTTRSAIFTHLSASLQGLTTIRACSIQKLISEEFDRHQDLHNSAFYLYKATFTCFGFWTDLICVLYNSLVIFSFFLFKSVSVANVGLAITQSASLLRMVQFVLIRFGELDSQMVSVERVLEYAELDPEADDGVNTPPENWPSSGNVSFHSVSLRYSSKNPAVLKNVSFQIKSGEKVGIVGRTGAGKTSLISVLFRLFHFDGFVLIDGVDTKAIPLNALRSKISIIPQEPVLFLGTLRKNIDPFNEHSDSQIWNCLEEIELKEMVLQLPSGLDSAVSERGSNFSVGQRQLLCLVRAMLRSNKIIVLDEATANVDLKNDELIQSTIRKKFKDCTVLTIAHRLNTVIDSDKILVMDDGSVIEFDHPEVLLRNTQGLFYEYVKSSRNLMSLRR